MICSGDMSTFIDKLISVRPTEEQITWQELGFTAFLHYGMNTFTNREWGNGSESPDTYNPTALDTDQWCEALTAAGIKGCIITAKHHDGFCLFDTAHTKHGVMHSPKPVDVVAALAKSCDRYGLKMGVYLSPWDRNAPTYGSGVPYDDFFCAQLEELTTRYGPLYSLWFDGACGEGPNGKKQVYDWPRYHAIIRKNQPKAVIAICGPDVRWIGNEAGNTRPSEWSVVPARLRYAEHTAALSQQADDDSFREKPIKSGDEDLGSREFLAGEGELCWYPAEVDVSIRPGWFYHQEEDGKVRSMENLLDIYEKSVGGNAVLLLNIPPDTTGQINPADALRLRELGAKIDSIYTNNLFAKAQVDVDGADKSELTAEDSRYWIGNGEQAELHIKLPKPETLTHIVLCEEVRQSQRIEAFGLSAEAGGNWQPVYQGTTVGFKRICRFTPTEAASWRISITQSRRAPTLRFIGGYQDPSPLPQPIKKEPNNMNSTVNISKEGIAVSGIVYAEAMFKRAADILGDYLHKITGAIITARQENPATIPEGNIVFVNEDFGDSGFALRFVGGSLTIRSGNGQAAVYAAYDLLERHAGCRFYTSAVEKIPSNRDLNFSFADEQYSPPIEFRELYYRDYENPQFAEKHKLSPSELHEGWGFWCHSFLVLFPAELYDEHPEYFALIDGKRKRDSQPCLSNEKVYEIMRDNLRRHILEKPRAKYWSVSQLDHAEYCRCPECKAKDDADDSPMGSMLHFVNRIAAEFPDKIISTLAYWYTRKPPKITRPAPNVHIMVCNIEAGRGKPIETDTENEGSKQELLEWAKICDKVFLWDYAIQFANLVSPFPNLRVLAPNIRFFVKNSVCSLFSQCNREKFGEFAELRGYMLAKLMWNPELDDREIMKDFLSGYYGEAGEHLLRYIDTMHDKMEECGKFLGLFHGPKDAAKTWLTPELFVFYSECFYKAEQAVSDKPELFTRVRHARMPLYYAGIVNGYGTKKEIFAMIETFDSLAKACGLEKVEEWKITVDMFVNDSRELHKGKVTIPTDTDVVPETIAMMEKLGADAVRDCDGTDFPEELKNIDAKVYATYYTTRKDNAWAKANPDEVQQCYIMTNFHTATEEKLTVPLMAGISDKLLQPNVRDDVKRWWEVIDRTTGEAIPTDDWQLDADALEVTVLQAVPFHEYTVSFLAYLIWDPVHMYNAIVNGWDEDERQITFDPRQPKTREFSMKRLREYLQAHPHVDVVRFTTFFHQFTLVFDELMREKYVDWYGYSASVSPYILELFEKEAGYPFRAEYVIDQGYYNNQYRIPSPQYLDFMAFQRREVCRLAKEMVDITHEHGKEAMMFLGDHWIGTEPFLDEFKTIGLDALVGSIGNGSTYRLISDVQGVKYREGRYLPYFFPDTFHEGGDPVKEARENWITSRRALLRKPIDRIGYGGYLKLVLDFPDFTDYIAKICDEFRLICQNTKDAKPYSVKTVAVLNAWGKTRSWGCHMVHHALYQKQNYSYSGVIEALSGAAFDVRFISFDDIKQNPAMLDGIDVILNIGDADTAHTGGRYWTDEKIVSTIRAFIYKGGGFIGVGEPSARQHQGRFFQLASVLGVEKETGLTLNYDKYNWEEHDHFITEGCQRPIDFGEGKKSIYALPGTTVLVQTDKEVQMAANGFGEGRAVYISGLPYSFENSRLLHRAVLWSCRAEAELKLWYSTNCNVDVHAYTESRKYCVVNNADRPQKTTVFVNGGNSFDVELEGGEIVWYKW